MSINNFDIIEPLLKFDRPGDYYFLEIIKRSKDGHKQCNGDNHARLIKDISIDAPNVKRSNKTRGKKIVSIMAVIAWFLLISTSLTMMVSASVDGNFFEAISYGFVSTLFGAMLLVAVVSGFKSKQLPHKGNVLVEVPENMDVRLFEKEYSTYSMESLARHKEEIIKLCEDNYARAYIRLNRRNIHSTSMALAEEIINKERKNNTMANPDKMLSSVKGRTPDEPDKTWIVDIDWEKDNDGKPVVDEVYAQKIVDMVESCTYGDNKGKRIVAQIPTKNGRHLISRPFNRQEFKQKMNAAGLQPIDIHEDNPTILYSA